MSYEIITASSIESLKRSVNAALLEGWRPLGGPVQDKRRHEYGTDVWFQAIVKEAP